MTAREDVKTDTLLMDGLSGEFRDQRSRKTGAQHSTDFQQRCTQKLEKLADVAMSSQNYNEAAERFSTILSLNPPNRVDILIKRSKAQVMMNSWEEALKDADEVYTSCLSAADNISNSAQVIKLDPSSHRGYEQRHAALHGAKRHAEAVEAFDTMLFKLEESPDDRVRGESFPSYRPGPRHVD